jgi:hypothetical protein
MSSSALATPVEMANADNTKNAILAFAGIDLWNIWNDLFIVQNF